MSKLRQKSEFNIEAAKLLIRGTYYASSIHCSYYSCLQLLKYSIKEFFDIDYEKLSVLISTSGMGTHQFIIDYVVNEIKRNLSFEDSRMFSRAIKDLKQYRIDADYNNIEINMDKGELALSKASEIRDYLKLNFHV